MKFGCARTLGTVALLWATMYVTSDQMAVQAQQKPPSSTANSPWTARTPDGQPDIQGVWNVVPEGGTTIYDYDIEAPAPAVAYPFERFGDLTKTFRPIIVDPPDHKIPYQPWAREKRQRLYEAAFNPKNRDEVDSQAFCHIQGPPRITYWGTMQIMQRPGQVLFLHELNHEYRVVPLDNRPHVTNRVKLFMGDSRGHWEGNTLVIDVSNYNARNWLDVAGDFYTDALHVVERITRESEKAMRYEATIEDPNVYTRPWKMVLRLGYRSSAEYQFLEEACHEGNRAMEATPVFGGKKR